MIWFLAPLEKILSTDYFFEWQLRTLAISTVGLWSKFEQYTSTAIQLQFNHHWCTRFSSFPNPNAFTPRTSSKSSQFPASANWCLNFFQYCLFHKAFAACYKTLQQTTTYNNILWIYRIPQRSRGWKAHSSPDARTIGPNSNPYIALHCRTYTTRRAGRVLCWICANPWLQSPCQTRAWVTERPTAYTCKHGVEDRSRNDVQHTVMEPSN